MSKLRKQAMIRIVICAVMLIATLAFAFLLLTGKLDGKTPSSGSANADSISASSESVEPQTPETT